MHTDGRLALAAYAIDPYIHWPLIEDGVQPRYGEF